MSSNKTIYRKVSQGEELTAVSDDENDDDHAANDELSTWSTVGLQPSSGRSSNNTACITTMNTTIRRTRSERISDKLAALAWVVAAIITAHYTNLFPALYSDTTRVIRPLLHLSLLLFGINTLLIIYLTIYLPYKFPTSKLHIVHASTPAFWEAYCPNVIPIMTGCGVLGMIVLVRAVYPVYGMASPLVLGVVGLGMFFGLHFIPVCW